MGFVESPDLSELSEDEAPESELIWPWMDCAAASELLCDWISISPTSLLLASFAARFASCRESEDLLMLAARLDESDVSFDSFDFCFTNPTGSSFGLAGAGFGGGPFEAPPPIEGIAGGLLLFCDASL